MTKKTSKKSSSKLLLPFIVGIATGLYPVIFYYTNNYALINSTKHLLYFVGFFLVVPSVGFFIVDKLFLKKLKAERKSMILTFLNVSAFLLFIQLCLYTNIQWLFTVITIVIAGAVAWFLKDHLKKIVAFQYILAAIALFSLIPNVISQLNYSDTWKEQPDDIESVVFTKRPNVYYIQPDGYVNFSELVKGFYQLEDIPLKPYLEEKQFTQYPDVRSNYTSTLSSNMATFTMKHHYNNYGFNFSELPDARAIIVNDNPVLRIFKNNNYKTHFIAEHSYIIANKPEIGYDRCNFSTSEIAYINDGFDQRQEVLPPLKAYLEEDPEQSKFFFIEIFKPGHVPAKKEEAKSKTFEKDKWLVNLNMADEKIRNVIDMIVANDPTALIMIMSDHGGSVGLTHMLETRTRTNSRDKLISTYSTNLAIRWPENLAPQFDNKMKTGVNVFRVLFSYLSDNTKYLEHLQEDSSFTYIEEGAPKGVYKVLDENGAVTFEKH